MPERLQPSQDREFSLAKKALYHVLDSEELLDQLNAAGVSPEAEDTPAYWRSVAEFASQLYPESQEEPFQAALNRLTLQSPYFAFVQYSMEHHAQHIPKDLWTHFKQTVSRFNAQVRHAAETNPQLSPRKLHAHLTSTINLAVDNDAVNDTSPGKMRDVIRGAQHELGSTQVALAAGLDATPGTTEQDLAACDVIIRDDANNSFEIDFKASQNTLRKQGAGETPYYVHPDGKIMMCSLVEDDDFEDRFFVSDHIAVKKAPELRKRLRQIAAMRQNRSGHAS